MPSNNQGTIITTRGLQLITKLVASQTSMQFTNVKVGTGSPDEGTDPSGLTHLVAYKMDGLIAEYGYDDTPGEAYVVMQISNSNIENGFVMTEIGVYAQDPDLGEILFAYVNLSDDPNYIMPAENGRSKTVQIKLHLIIGEVSGITATINPLAQVTRAEFDRAIQDLAKMIGQVKIGAENTELSNHDTLFIVGESESLFRGVSYTNMTFGAAASGNELWAQVGGEARESEENGLGIVEGKLSVSEHPAPDADFFAKIND